MPSFTVVDSDRAQDITCAICLMPWNDPVEIQPCRHVFCKACCIKVNKCPDCRGEIKNRAVPNRILINMSKEIEMKCDECGWIGANENTVAHRCGGGGPPSRSPSRSPQTISPRHSQSGGGYVDPYQQQPAVAQPPPQQPAYPQQQQHQQQQPYQQQPQAAPSVHSGNSGGGYNSAAPFLSRPSAVPQRPLQPWEKFGLSQDEYDHIMCVFMTFDTDGSGALDKRELTVLCRWLNFAHSPEDVDRMFREMDSDGNGSLDLDEFCTWLSRHRPDPQALYGMSPVEYQNVLFQFHTFDADQNGTLDREEFAGLCVRQGYCRTKQEGYALFAQVDTDRSGAVDLHELLTYRAAHARGGYAAAPPMPPPQQQQQHPGMLPPGQQNAYLQQQPHYPPPQQQAPPYGQQQYQHGVPPPQHQQQYPPQQQQQQQQQNQQPPQPIQRRVSTANNNGGKKEKKKDDDCVIQ